MKKISRRTFSSTLIKGAGGLALVGGLPFHALGNPVQKKKLGLALVGLGGY